MNNRLRKIYKVKYGDYIYDAIKCKRCGKLVLAKFMKHTSYCPTCKRDNSWRTILRRNDK